MQEYFDEELCNWLMIEMAQNRDKKLVAQKVCSGLWAQKVCSVL